MILVNRRAADPKGTKSYVTRGRVFIHPCCSDREGLGSHWGEEAGGQEELGALVVTAPRTFGARAQGAGALGDGADKRKFVEKVVRS